MLEYVLQKPLSRFWTGLFLYTRNTVYRITLRLPSSVSFFHGYRVVLFLPYIFMYSTHSVYREVTHLLCGYLLELIIEWFNDRVLLSSVLALYDVKQNDSLDSKYRILTYWLFAATTYSSITVSAGNSEILPKRLRASSMYSFHRGPPNSHT